MCVCVCVCFDSGVRFGERVVIRLVQKCWWSDLGMCDVLAFGMCFAKVLLVALVMWFGKVFCFGVWDVRWG